MAAPSENRMQSVRLGDDALDRIAATLAELYHSLYEERPLDARASLNDNMLAFVFEDGLSVADERLLQGGRDDRLQEFREHFLRAADAEMVAVVSALTELPVTYSFYGFDVKTRTTHAIFVLDLTALNGSEERQAVLNWSEQVRRNARLLREQHVAARTVQRDLTEKMREHRERLQSEADGDGAGADGSEESRRSDDR
jgi:uncharacterized protein YbcI